MSGFAKLFSRVAQSSLMEQPLETRYVFLMLLPIADAQGHVIGTDIALARQINVPVETFKDAVRRLMEPDSDSNSPAEEGRRIIPSDKGRGYKLVNYLTYRNSRDEDHRREYMRNLMAEKRRKAREASCDLLAVVSSVSTCEQSLAQAEAEAEADNRDNISPISEPAPNELFPMAETAPDQREAEALEIYDLYPRKDGRKDGLKAIRKALQTHTPAFLKEKLRAYAEHCRATGKESRFICLPATWFNGERWNDDLQTAPPANPDRESRTARGITLKDKKAILEKRIEKVKQALADYPDPDQRTALTAELNRLNAELTGVENEILAL